MFNEKYSAVIINSSEILGCETMQPIWNALRWYVPEYENVRIALYENGVHISTIAAAPNGRIYYRRIKSLKQYDITELFARFAQ